MAQKKDKKTWQETPNSFGFFKIGHFLLPSLSCVLTQIWKLAGFFLWYQLDLLSPQLGQRNCGIKPITRTDIFGNQITFVSLRSPSLSSDT